MRRQLYTNTALLTASSLLMSCIGMAFQVWLVGRIGSAGIGLYELTVSVTNLCATFAISGIRFGTTRLVAEELGLDKAGGLGAVMGRCLAYGAFFGAAALAVLWLLAEPIGFLWIGDARTVLSLRISAFSMPCVSLCSSLSGYFTACGRVWKPTLVHLLEQLAGIALVALFLRRAPAGDIEKSCAAVTAGRLAADLLSLLLMGLAYWEDRRHICRSAPGRRLTARMLHIAVPLALSAYARSALTTFQHLLVPRGLKAAAAELIVPELTEAQVRRDTAEIRRSTRTLLRLSLLFSGAVAAFLFLFSDPLALAVYKNADAGYYIRVLAPLVPLMYTDMSVDGCLKGLGQQVWSMGINIVEAALGLLLIWTLLPRYALTAYIAIVYFSEIFNFILSLWRLRRVLLRP